MHLTQQYNCPQCSSAQPAVLPCMLPTRHSGPPPLCCHLHAAMPWDTASTGLLTNVNGKNQTRHSEGGLCRREGGLHSTKDKDIRAESARSGMWNVSAQQSDKMGQSPAAMGRRRGSRGQKQHGSSTQHHTHAEISCCSAQRCHFKPMCWSLVGRLEAWKSKGMQSSKMRGTGSLAPPGKAFCHFNCKPAHQGHQHQGTKNYLSRMAAAAQRQVLLWRAQAQLWDGAGWDLTSLTGLWLCTVV